MFSDKIPIFSLMAAHANAIALAGRQSKILPHGIFCRKMLLLGRKMLIFAQSKPK